MSGLFSLFSLLYSHETISNQFTECILRTVSSEYIRVSSSSYQWGLHRLISAAEFGLKTNQTCFQMSSCITSRCILHFDWSVQSIRDPTIHICILIRSDRPVERTDISCVRAVITLNSMVNSSLYKRSK